MEAEFDEQIVIDRYLAAVAGIATADEARSKSSLRAKRGNPGNWTSWIATALTLLSMNRYCFHGISWCCRHWGDCQAEFFG